MRLAGHPGGGGPSPQHTSNVAYEARRWSAGRTASGGAKDEKAAASGERAFNEFRQAFLEGVKLVSACLQDTIAKWQLLLGEAGFSREQLELLAGQKYEAILRRVQDWTFQSFRRRLTRLGQELARRQVPLERVMAAHDLLLEVWLPCLEMAPGKQERHMEAMARMHSLAGRILVSAYSRRLVRGMASLLGNLREMHHRLMESSAYATSVYEQERRRLSHDLHDEIGHDLIMLKLSLEMIAQDLAQGRPREARPRTEEALSLVSAAVEGVRRLVQDLGPAIFDELGFLPAIKLYARKFSARTGIPVSVSATKPPENLPMSHQVALYRILQGALSNVMEHSKARHVKVSLGSRESSMFIMVIEDDGVGFDVDAVSLRRSFGLTAMRERAEALGGRLDIQSSRAGLLSEHHGTRVEVDLPLRAAEGRQAPE